MLDLSLLVFFETEAVNMRQKYATFIMIYR